MVVRRVPPTGSGAGELVEMSVDPAMGLNLCTGGRQWSLPSLSPPVPSLVSNTLCPVLGFLSLGLCM